MRASEITERRDVLLREAGQARSGGRDRDRDRARELTRTAAERRDLHAAYHPTDAKALGKRVRSIDWPAYWKGLGAAPSKEIIIGTPRLFAALDQLRARFSPAQWASYFTYHLIQALALAMPGPLDEAAFELDDLVTGVEHQRERSPPKFRVYGALRNLPEFAEAFRCAPGTPMRPARTCTVW